jgi:hypothetical protein
MALSRPGSKAGNQQIAAHKKTGRRHGHGGPFLQVGNAGFYSKTI